MALTVVPSTRVFNGNVGTQAFVSGSTGSKCLCCPYGYHIDLDFVRYCEAVAAGSAGDRSSIERRKKRERRRQCQSMEVLLGLVSPTLAGIEAELTKIPQGPATTNGVTSSSRSSHDKPGYAQVSTALDLSDVVGDFEATLRRSSRSTNTSDKQERSENGQTNLAFIYFYSSRFVLFIESRPIDFCRLRPICNVFVFVLVNLIHCLVPSNSPLVAPLYKDIACIRNKTKLEF
ncbi:hypothetical protein K0M31_017799 [Melipona bicolor]|uniref:Uncharacterized protein n=1 Tax=Melipona bicolor TaxID=60889 RepID=A0AA40G5R9_9HYME|nr:hypothetical protein K0M31_017799 [Melipona bicolor]